MRDRKRVAVLISGRGSNMRALIEHEHDYAAVLVASNKPHAEGLDWAVRSVEYAFSLGVGCCSVIPTRAGNGMMERLQEQGFFTPPQFRSLERALEAGIGMGRGRVFVDLWDVERQVPCPTCGPARIERLRRMNLTQTILPTVECDCGTA